MRPWPLVEMPLFVIETGKGGCGGVSRLSIRPKLELLQLLFRYFMFRVADTRTSHLLEAHVRAQIVWKRVTKEGELVTHHQQEILVQGEGERGDKILLFWPTTIIHEIDKESPLVGICPKDLQPENPSFEIIVVLEGVLETTGLMTQARSSFAPHEVITNIIHPMVTT